MTVADWPDCWHRGASTAAINYVKKRADDASTRQVCIVVFEEHWRETIVRE